MEELFWKLYNSDSESELEEVIRNNSIFDDPENWKPYGGLEGNFGTFESQQNNPIPALIEKITNSIDATLIKACNFHGIDPRSKNAPRSMDEAVELFYRIKKGEIGSLPPKIRRKLAENIQVLVSGDKIEPCITIFDNGEGQLPEDFQKTFLSLHRGNKTNIHFVQGKYNMGSTGAVVFCGEKKYQLIASKKNKGDNYCSELFGFTLVRKHPLNSTDVENNVKTTWYEFFCPKRKIPSFTIDTIDLGLYNTKFSGGSIVKLYSYQLPQGSRSDATLDLWRDLNQYLFYLPLPISIVEKREFKAVETRGIAGGHSKVILGNKVRINENKKIVKKIIQFAIPNELNFGKTTIDVIVFKSDINHGEYIKNKSIIFTQNGQIHAFKGQSFISQNLGFSLLKKFILIHVDCTNIPTEIRQDLFMSNRTHLKECSKTNHLLDEIVSLLKESKELKRLNNERKNALLRDSKSDEDLIEELLSKLPVNKDVVNLLKRDGALDFFKKKGSQFTAQKNIDHSSEEKTLNRFPSIFNLNLKKDKEGKLYKTIPINSKGKVTIETDAEDDYLFRSVDKGTFEIHILQKRNKSKTSIEKKIDSVPNDTVDVININREGPVNGDIKLLIKPNQQSCVGDEIKIQTKLTSKDKDLECVFYVKVDKEIAPPKRRKRPPTETFPNFPIPSKAFRDKKNKEDLIWSDESLNWTGDDIVKVVTGAEENEMIVDGIIINMDSFSLLKFISNNKIKTEKEISFIKDKYFVSIYLHSLFLLVF